MKLYKCSVCGYVMENEGQPECNCIKCKATPDKFVELDENASKLIYMSDRTNDILAELIELSMKMDKLALEGLEIKLDPTCVRVFEETKKRTWQIKQLAKSEIAGHLSKGKW
ncbi:MAG: rubredoxin-like domain-containing protein [Lachnospirales bacterium]